MVLTLKPCTFSNNIERHHYEYYLAVSSDKLLILKRMDESYMNFDMVECIVDGIDNRGTLFSCPDEDTFLDAIIVIKNVLFQGKNPLLEIEIVN